MSIGSAGVSDFNRTRFQCVHALLDELKMDYKPVDQGASFMMPDGETVLDRRLESAEV